MAGLLPRLRSVLQSFSNKKAQPLLAIDPNETLPYEPSYTSLVKHMRRNYQLDLLQTPEVINFGGEAGFCERVVWVTQEQARAICAWLLIQDVEVTGQPSEGEPIERIAFHYVAPFCGEETEADMYKQGKLGVMTYWLNEICNYVDELRKENGIDE